MFGIQFVKFQPNEYVVAYRNGKVAKQGAGLAFTYYAPNTSIVMVPVASMDCPFIFDELTGDFQTVSVQGQVTYRVIDPLKLTSLLDFTVEVKKGKKTYVSEDPETLSYRISTLVRVMAKKQLAKVTLSDAVRSMESLAWGIQEDLRQNQVISSLGIEILGFSLLNIQPNKETARALEAQTREDILRLSDNAIYERRNASIAQERGVKENEYNTEISMELKRRQVRETQLQAEQAELAKQNELKMERLAAEIALEEKRKELIALSNENDRARADVRAYELKAMMNALAGVDSTIIHSLATIGMEPQAIIASAFQSLAGSAEKIGQLNITPDLMREMMHQ